MSKGAETRGRIVTRALEIASVQGLDGVTIGELAKELELSKSGLFAHFRSKEELQLQVLQAGIDRFVETVIRPALREPRGEPRLRALLERWLAWAEGEALPGGCIVTSTAVEVDDRPGPLRDALAAALQEWLGVIARVTRTGVEEGHFRRDLDVGQFVFEIYGAYLAFFFVHRTLRDPAAARQARATLDARIAAARA